MMRNKILILFIFSSTLLAVSSARADGVAVGAGVSSLGYGVHVATELNSFVALRLNGNFGDIDVPDYGLLSGNLGGINYDIDAKFKSVGLLADIHPLGLSPIGDGFVLTGGMYYNKNEFDFTAGVPAGTVIGGTPLPGPATVISKMTFDQEFAPYAGLGYDGTFKGVVPISFFLTAGVMFQGSPSVVMSESSGSASPADLAAEARQIESDAKDFKYYPVVALGITISF